MAGKSQHFSLSHEEDEQLRRFEQSGHIRPKVRLRAQVVRLNAAGWSRLRIAQHTGRTYGTVCQDLKRWHERGVEGLADAPATNQPEKLTAKMRELVLEKLQEDRTELGPTGRALPVLLDLSPACRGGRAKVQGGR
jgi:hypothetical protein